MKLFGWDTISAIDLVLVNQALEAGSDRLVTTFDHKGQGVRVTGRFGTWSVMPGGSMRKLHMRLFIREGSARMVGRRGRHGTNLAGMALSVEVPLELVPSPDGTTPATLKFDFGAGDEATDGGIVPLDLDDPEGRLSALDAEMVKIALGDCLTHNRQHIGFVFATITPGAVQKGTTMYTPHLDWAMLNAGDGRSYLAVLGSLTPPTAAMQPDKIDPELIAGQGAAYFACSRKIFSRNILAPWLSQNFNPKAQFQPNGSAAHLARPIGLPPVKTVVGDLRPQIQKMIIGPYTNALRINLSSVTPVNNDVAILADMTLNMPMYVKDGKVGIKPDPKPKVRHEVRGKGIFGGLIAKIVELVMNVFGHNVGDMARGVAKKFQNINVPAAAPVAWTGTRKFVTTVAKSEDCLWFCDTRPA